jgi:hypothetical protein
MIENDPYVKLLSRHILALRLFLKRNQEKSEYRITTLIVLSINEQWYLITAGHYFLDSEKGLKPWLDNGWELESCQLIDCLGPNPKDHYPVPFVFRFEDWQIVYEDEDKSFDFAVLPLSSYYKNLMISNGIVALNEDTWDKQPNNPQTYLLLGNPADLLYTEDKEWFWFRSVSHVIEPLDEMPEGFVPADLPLFYGRISLPDEIESIRGESGGPIFAFEKNEKGESRYWLVALQSRWVSPGFIAACPTRSLGIAVRDFFSSKSSGDK